MNSHLEELYQAIGQLAVASTLDLQGQLLVYAEVQDGVVAASLFYEKGPAKTVTFKFCSDELEDKLYELWEQWQKVPNNKPWFGLAYLLQGNKMSIDLSYPDELNENEGLRERRPRIVQRYFGNVKVDFSKPE